MDICPLCFDSMDMLSYEDERSKTDSCYKLDCGHAYHTACIIDCLSKTDHKCPSCNKHKTPEKELTREGIVKRLVSELKRNTEVKPFLNEFLDAKVELSTTLDRLKQDVKQYIINRSEELLLSKKQEYMAKCLSTLRSTCISIANKKGPLYRGVLTSQENHYYRYPGVFNRVFFGKPTARTIYKLKNPTFRCDINQCKKTTLRKTQQRESPTNEDL